MSVKMQQVRAMAKRLGVNIGGLGKVEAIRKIQRSEGNFDCFGRAATGYCDQTECVFYDDCMKASCEPKCASL